MAGRPEEEQRLGSGGRSARRRGGNGGRQGADQWEEHGIASGFGFWRGLTGGQANDVWDWE